MTLPTIALANRPFAAVLPCLVLALIGCGGESSSSDGGGDGGTHGGSAGAGDSGGTASGGTAGVEAGGSGGKGGATTGGKGGTSAGGKGGTGTGGSGGTGTGGIGNSGGSAAAAGAAGMAGEGGSSTGSCVNISGAGDEPWYDLTVVGTEFDADEGARMRIVVATAAPNRVGIADVPIVNGSFSVSMPGVLNAGWYEGLTLYVDRNDNDVCEPDEPVWQMTTAAVTGDLRYEFTPDQRCMLGACGRPPPMPPACWVGGGDTVLTEPLTCNP
jgi:hypothetical protein